MIARQSEPDSPAVVQASQRMISAKLDLVEFAATVRERRRMQLPGCWDRRNTEEIWRLASVALDAEAQLIGARAREHWERQRQRR